jgi:hypothetical protein
MQKGMRRILAAENRMSGISKNGDLTGWSDGVFTKASDSWVGTGSFTV